MLKFSKIYLYFLIGFLCVWLLPWAYAFLSAKKSNTPFTMYSTINDDFIRLIPDGEKGSYWSDSSGARYTQEQADSLLPMFYIRQLTADERFPDTIKGIAVSPKEVTETNFTFHTRPADLNRTSTNLYFLLESQSQRVDLYMPDDVFRFTDKGIEFIEMKTNKLKEDKSQLFTEALLSKGFVFPATFVNGNPSVRKEYDEGYLVLDANNHLFHLKRVKNQPYVAQIPLPKNVTAEYVFITEYKRHQSLGYLIDSNNAFYVIQDEKSIIKTGIPSFDPRKDKLMILGNMFDWTVRITREHDESYYAIDAQNYSLIKEYIQKDAYKYIWGLAFTDEKDMYVKPRF